MDWLPIEYVRVKQEDIDRMTSIVGSPFLARLLASRGVTGVETHAGRGERLLHWTLLTDANKAAVRLANAIMGGENIVVVADYDCDGATSCSVMLRGITGMGGKISFYVPNRFIDGYGLTPSLAEKVKKRFPDTKVIVTVDNGILSFDGVETANSMNIDVVVTDHHLGGEREPNAVAVVNPNKKGCSFPSKNLAGVGVAFYTIAALRDCLAQRQWPKANFPIGDLMDIVAIGTIADVVKLDKNNRLIAKMGLDRIRAGMTTPGIKALFEVSGDYLARATSQTISFRIAPKLNAAGRLDDMSIGIRLLTTDSEEEAKTLAEALNAYNLERREIEKGMQEIAIESVMSHDGVKSSYCLHDKSFHEGVVGLVAGKIKEQINRPTFAFAEAEDGCLKGSGRSIMGFHLKDALELVAKERPNLLKKFGGHAMAAGVTIRGDGLSDFSEALESVAQRLITKEMLDRRFIVDDSLRAIDMTVNNVELIETEPWGQDFPEPLFVKKFRIIEASLMGKEKNHQKLLLEAEGERFDAVWFGMKDLLKCDYAEIVFSLSTNFYRGETKLQLMIKQARPV